MDRNRRFEERNGVIYLSVAISGRMQLSFQREQLCPLISSAENKTSLSGRRTAKFTSGKGHTGLTFSGTRGKNATKNKGKIDTRVDSLLHRRRSDEASLLGG